MAGDTATSVKTGNDTPGFFSSAGSFSLPIGGNFDDSGVRGYYIDMSTKATPVWPGYWLFVGATQWGLGCLERYLAGQGEVWLAAARERGEELLAQQQRDGHLAGGFLHQQPMPATFALRTPWISAMAQGEAASFFVRMLKHTSDERYADAARLALRPLSVAVADGGVRTLLGGRPFFEEYPTQPSSYVLNGAIFTLWGLYDVGVALDDAPARTTFDEALDTLAGNLHRWDLGYWSRYDLYPHPVANAASSFYHDLHINQLRAMHRIAPRPQLVETADRWGEYAASALCRRRAFAAKVAFRLLVPRSSFLARRLPWSPLRGI